MSHVKSLLLAGTILAAVWAAPVLAGEDIIYERAPGWVVPAQVPDTDDEPGKPLRYISAQVRLENGQTWQYHEMVFALTTPEYLTAFGTVAPQWIPDKGDLRVHQVALERDGETIDILANGATFDVLRREQQLERRSLDGLRTATMTIPGARVGDQLRVAYSVTTKDQALGDEYEFSQFLIADPAPLMTGNVQASWPESEGVQFQAIHFDKTLTPQLIDGDYRLSVALPIAKRDDMPQDAPSRFHFPPMLQLTSFDDWRDISATLAPHFATSGLPSSDAGLMKRVAAIRDGNAGELARAAAALQLVQDEISYLHNGLDGGNYLPQSPAETWEKRFGDCKAKSLLLLAMLRELGITGQVALVRAQGGDVIPDLLPAPGNFDHMIVRAVIGGETYWLDGTATGSRLANIADVPRFAWALPLMAEGSDLVAMDARPLAQPHQDLTIVLDHSGGVKLPVMFDITVRSYGQAAAPLRVLADFEEGAQKNDAISGILSGILGSHQHYDSSIAYDDTLGVATVRAKGIMTSPWEKEDGRYRLSIPYQPAADFAFDNDRARAQWRDLPVSINAPFYARAKVAIVLPQENAGEYRVVGNADFDRVIGGNRLQSQGTMEGHVFTLTQEVASQAWELSADELPQVKRESVQLTRSLPKIVAPRGSRELWEYRGKAAALLEPAEQVYTRLIAEAEADDDDAVVRAHWNRAAFRAGVSDFAGALRDVDKAIGRQPSAVLYAWRADLRRELGDTDGMLADLEEAEEQEPDGSTYADRIAQLGEMGRGAQAVALAREYSGFADNLDDADRLLAEAHGLAGDTGEGFAILERLVAESPNDGGLRNSLCWYSATWDHRVAGSFEHCERAVQIGADSSAALDSRALAHFRMGAADRAIADLDNVLASASHQHSSRYLRGIIRLENGDPGGREDIDAALFASPSLERRYRIWGLQPAR